jgi:colicin import membrane protein
MESRGKARAWVGAILVHLVLVAVLVFSVRWKQQPAETVVVDIVAPTLKVAPQPVQPPAPVAPQPAPVVEPPPTPPKPAPAETTKSVVRPPAEIAREKALLEKQRVEKARDDAAKKAAEELVAKKEAAKKEQVSKEAQRKEVDKKLADARTKELSTVQERAAKELKDQRAAQEKTAREKETAEKATRELAEQQAAQARTEQADRAAKEAAAARARTKSEGEYVAKIRGKIRGNIILANEPPGNPEAVFEVNQLPTGEVLDVRLTKSSGNPAYDQAVERAILKSSPLPKPDQPEVFQRRLMLRFRPNE